MNLFGNFGKFASMLCLLILYLPIVSLTSSPSLSALEIARSLYDLGIGQTEATNLRSDRAYDLKTGQELFERKAISSCSWSNCSTSVTPCCLAGEGNYPTCLEFLDQQWCCHGSQNTSSCVIYLKSNCSGLSQQCGIIDSTQDAQCCPSYLMCVGQSSGSAGLVVCQAQLSEVEAWNEQFHGGSTAMATATADVGTAPAASTQPLVTVTMTHTSVAPIFKTGISTIFVHDSSAEAASSSSSDAAAASTDPTQPGAASTTDTDTDSAELASFPVTLTQPIVSTIVITANPNSIASALGGALSPNTTSSADSTATANTDSSNGPCFSTGAIVGTVIGCVAFMALFGMLLWWYLLRSPRQPPVPPVQHQWQRTELSAGLDTAAAALPSPVFSELEGSSGPMASPKVNSELPEQRRFSELPGRPISELPG